MAHRIKTSKPNRATSKKVACCICGDRDVPARMRREPPVSGPWVCAEGDCRDEKRKKDREG